ncbi:condensin complex subunit 2/barren [Dichotomocladium elegans]|nr:condensin complex subunit 2/barren [Dichotomocladium elegans]
MTRSPFQAANRPPSTNERRAQNKSTAINKDDNRAQRERLTKDVRSRQVDSSGSMSSGGIARSGPIEVSSTAPAAPSLTPEQMYSNFEEWIKMATDNKINANNSWNFALIDYFHEMTFLRDGDSINFQKASISLDGCVKIYTSRVDSVASETGKLLSGLANSSSNGDDDDDDLNRGDGGERRVRRRGNRADSTLLKDFSSIAVKKFDLDFAVDPLFKKTSADFDEGGARGLLLNHLHLDRECKIIFDASDASNAETNVDKEDIAEIPQGNDDDGNDVDDDNDNNNETQEEERDHLVDTEADEQSLKDNADQEIHGDQDVLMDDAEPETPTGKPIAEPMDIDMAEEQSDVTIAKPTEETRKESVVEISRLKARLPPFEVLKDLQICPSLQGYNFFSKTDVTIPNLEEQDDTNDDMQNLPEKTNDEPTLNVNQDFDDDLGMDFFDYDDNDGGDAPDVAENNFMENDDEANENEDDNGASSDRPAVDEQAFLKAMITGDGDDLFSYFDNTFAKNWAGPEHWKLRRPVSNARPNETPDNENGEDAEKSRKKAKPAFQIDFINGEDADEDEIFATDKRVRVTMSATKESAVENNTHLLPDDMHFSSKQLLRLFLKPKAVMRSRKKATQKEDTPEITTPLPANENDAAYDDFEFEPDTQFWADQKPGESQLVEEQENIDASAVDQTQLSMYDDTSFYQDSYYDGLDDPDASQYGDPLITSHRLKKTKPLYVNYAKTAKRVDVKKLKDNLWKVMTKSKVRTMEIESFLSVPRG